MPIDLTCSCGKQLRVADEHAGRQGRCPICGAVLDIPERQAVVSGVELPPLEAPPATIIRPIWPEAAEPESPDEAVTARPTEPAELRFGELEISRPVYRLFSPGTVGVTAFLGGPLGAFFLLAINFWRLGKRRASWLTLGISLLTLVGLVLLLPILPSCSGLTIGVLLFFLLWGAARTLQGRAFEEHRRRGGRSASGWSAFGFALLGLVLYFGVFFGVYLAYDIYHEQSLGPKVEFGGGEEIYYVKGATEADARALGAFLREAGVFDGRSPMSVRIALDGNRVVISFVVQEWVLKDAELQREYRQVGQEASQRVFGGRPVTVELCDEYLNVKKRL